MFVECRLAVVVISVAARVSLVAVYVSAVVAASSVGLATIPGVVVDGELVGFGLDFLVVSSVVGVCWVGSALRSFHELFVLLVVNEQVGVAVHQRVCTSLASKLGLTASDKDALADVVSGFLEK